MFNLESHEDKYLLCDKLEVLFSWLSFFNLKNKEKVESITSSYLKKIQEALCGMVCMCGWDL